ncbi:MAG TPA: hypothetical protein VE964_06185 [Myxococcales bacterium]|nr:hypothetical protein [Myxococcales bacterium]
MLFKKLFRLLVLGGAIVGAGTRCAGMSQSQKTDSQSGGSADGGVAGAQDGGTSASGGGGVIGW